MKLVSDFLREELVIEEDTINNALISSFSVKAGKSLVEDLKNVTAKLAKTLEELKQIIIPISNAGVDIFDYSEINYTDSAVTGKSGNLSYWVKKIANKPTITTGGIGSPEILYKDIPTLITEITSQPKMSYLHLQRKKAQIFYSNNLVSDFKEGGFDLLAFGRPLLINENWFDEITEED